jgi:hypothetical protein
MQCDKDPSCIYVCTCMQGRCGGGRSALGPGIELDQGARPGTSHAFVSSMAELAHSHHAELRWAAASYTTDHILGLGNRSISFISRVSVQYALKKQAESLWLVVHDRVQKPTPRRQATTVRHAGMRHADTPLTPSRPISMARVRQQAPSTAAASMYVNTTPHSPPDLMPNTDQHEGGRNSPGGTK